MKWEVSQPEEGSCSGFWWYGSRHFYITCQMAAGWTGCCWGRYCLLVSFRLYAGTSPHWWKIDENLGSFNHPLQSLSVLGHAQTMPVRMLSIAPLQKLTRTWQGNFALLSFLKKYSCFWAFLTRVEMWDDHDMMWCWFSGTWNCSPVPPQLHWCRQGLWFVRAVAVIKLPCVFCCVRRPSWKFDGA